MLAITAAFVSYPQSFIPLVKFFLIFDLMKVVAFFLGHDLLHKVYKSCESETPRPKSRRFLWDSISDLELKRQEILPLQFYYDHMDIKILHYATSTRSAYQYTMPN